MSTPTTKLMFKVEGSRGDVYDVGFGRKGAGIMMLCSCPAGSFGTHCRHRLKLLCGDVTDLLSGNGDDVALLKGLIEGTALERVLADLDASELEAAAIAKRIKNLKAQVGRLMEGDVA